MSIQDDGVYLIDGTRTAIGAYGGSLAHTRPDDMAATIIRSLLQRPSGGGSEPGRSGSGLRQPGRRGQPQCRPHGGAACRTDPSVPAITLNRLCASGLDAVIYAAAKSAAALAN